MQPYFFPYAGYYRLFAQADCFVILDSVQFPRRGRVHRCRIPQGASERWLTLPLAKAPQATRICDIQLAPDAGVRLIAELSRQPWMGVRNTSFCTDLTRLLSAPGLSVGGFLETSLRLVVDELGFDCEIVKSSDLDIPDGLTAQSRIIDIVKQVGGTAYLNAPGGRDLYDCASFSEAGLQLKFLPDYRGQIFHMLPALFTMEAAALRADIVDGAAAAEGRA